MLTMLSLAVEAVAVAEAILVCNKVYLERK
jgi:hypothetical protein